MLPARCRLHSPREYSRVMRSGTRAARTHVVVHYASSLDAGATHVGFVVPKKVAGAVGRNLVRRRFRAIIAGTLDHAEEFGLVTDCGDMVLRALPGAAELEFQALRSEVLGSLKVAQKRFYARGATF